MKTSPTSSVIALSVTAPTIWLRRTFLILSLLLGAKIFVLAQNNQLETDKGLLQSIAPYNADVRKSILLASQNVDVLEQAQQIRNRSQKTFQNIIKRFDQKEQGYFYEITRYPNVLRSMATNADLRRNEVEDLVGNASNSLKDNAWQLYRNNRRELVEVYELNQTADQDYQHMIQDLDAPTKAAFRQLANYPDVMTLLSDNMDLTTRLGERYATDREALNRELAEMHDTMIAQRQYDIAEYKRKLEQNPEASRELDDAADEYAQSNNYILPRRDQDVYITNNYYYSNPNSFYYSNPYSYWCGYPYWYTTPLWYPNAYWYDFRFSFGIGSYGFYGFPTYGFANWFYYGGYYRRYPTLYASFGNYYRHYADAYYGRPSRYYYGGRAVPYRNNRDYYGYNDRNYNNRNYNNNRYDNARGNARGNTNRTYGDYNSNRSNDNRRIDGNSGYNNNRGYESGTRGGATRSYEGTPNTNNGRTYDNGRANGNSGYNNNRGYESGTRGGATRSYEGTPNTNNGRTYDSGRTNNNSGYNNNRGYESGTRGGATRSYEGAPNTNNGRTYNSTPNNGGGFSGRSYDGGSRGSSAPNGSYSNGRSGGNSGGGNYSGGGNANNGGGRSGGGRGPR